MKVITGEFERVASSLNSMPFYRGTCMRIEHSPLYNNKHLVTPMITCCHYTCTFTITVL